MSNVETSSTKYRFIQDNDCHWYLIPATLSSLFIQMEDNGEADGWSEFNDKFEEYRCNSPSNYTFENVEEK